jgi:hypothetical protein
MRALILVPLVLVVACAHPVAPVGLNGWHECLRSSKSGEVQPDGWWCPEYSSCELRTDHGRKRHLCAWLGDPEGPGWGDILQEGGEGEVP